MYTVGGVIRAMTAYYAGDTRRINHFIKVYGFAKAIGELERLDRDTQDILEIAAVTHDIGIRNSEQKYGSSDGAYQQLEGPPEAERMLSNLGIHPAVIRRVCFLIAHHHTYHNIQGLDYQILVEADFLVNIFEDHMPAASVQAIRERIFRTAAGKAFLDDLLPA